MDDESDWKLKVLLDKDLAETQRRAMEELTRSLSGSSYYGNGSSTNPNGDGIGSTFKGSTFKWYEAGVSGGGVGPINIAPTVTVDDSGWSVRPDPPPPDSPQIAIDVAVSVLEGHGVEDAEAIAHAIIGRLVMRNVVNRGE